MRMGVEPSDRIFCATSVVRNITDYILYSSEGLMEQTKSVTKVVKCPTCHKVIFDGKVLKSRITLFEHDPARAMCSGCKNWVEIPQVRCAL